MLQIAYILFFSKEDKKQQQDLLNTATLNVQCIDKNIFQAQYCTCYFTKIKQTVQTILSNAITVT